jgi:hypothetical protein
MARPTVDIIHARPTHIGPIAVRMRAADRIEAEAMGHSPKGALRHGYRLSLKPLTVVVDGHPEAMMGVVPQSLMGGRGTVWMLGTDEIYRHPRELALLGPRILAGFLEECPILENIVAISNRRAISFIKHLGFNVDGATIMCGGVEFVGFKYTIQDKARAA